MAHYKRRKRTDPRHQETGRKTFKVRGVSPGNPWDYSHINVRQRLKRMIWEGWE